MLALASVMSLLAGAKMIVRRTCSPLKAVHRRYFTPERERRLSLVCGSALQVVGAPFAASACLAVFACVPSSKNRQIRLSNFDTLMLTASGRAGAVAAGPPAA